MKVSMVTVKRGSLLITQHLRGSGMLQDISRLVIGKDPMRTDELWERMFKVSFWGQGGGRLFLQLSAPLTLP